MTRTFFAFFLAVALVVLGVQGTNDAHAQTLPIPGLPGGLGGVSTPDPAPAPAPQAPAPQASADQTSTASPTQALIDILRDDAARDALIQELEAASGQGPTSPAATEAAPEAEPVLSEEPIQTFGDRAVEATRGVGAALVSELENIWIRLKRIPITFELSTRALEHGALVAALSEVVAPAFLIYATLFILRLMLQPIRKRIAAAAQLGGWIKKLFLRVAASSIDVVVIPLSVTIGVVFVVLLGFMTQGPEEEVVFSDAQALFINAYVTIEVVRVGLRFILSPGSPSLRMISLPERGVAHLWQVSRIVLYVIGYAQLFLVPTIGAGVSIFVGRAVASVVSAVVVTLLIVYVLSKRRAVADWLADPDADKQLSSLFRPLALRWHWPILLYLSYLLVTVITNPGNVLLPLLKTTGEAIFVIALGSMVLNGLTIRASQRMPVPALIRDRLPLLEERINQIRPAFLGILRFFVFFIMLVILLNIFGLQGIGGLISGAVLQQFSSGLFSVVLIVSMLSLAWLAMTSWVDFRLNPFVGSVPTSREITLLTLMKNAATVAIVIIGIITSLAQLGVNVGPLIASAGVIGLAISFGAQRMVEDIFSGIFIQAENAMNVGDVVDVGGTVGTVEKLTVRSVTLRDLAGVVHVIPFSSAAKVSNYMRDFAYHVADIGVAYREQIEDVREALHDAFDRLRADEDHTQNIIGDLEWFGLNAFGPSELVVRARIKTLPGMQWGIGRAYNAIVKDIFDERGIEIPFPHQTVYFGEDKSGRAPPLHMRVERARASKKAGEEDLEPAPAPTVPRPEIPIAEGDMPDADGR